MDVVWDISDEKYFHHFSNSYLEAYFWYIQLKISCFLVAKLIAYVEYVMKVQIKPMETIEIFDEIM